MLIKLLAYQYQRSSRVVTIRMEAVDSTAYRSAENSERTSSANESEEFTQRPTSQLEGKCMLRESCPP